MLIQSARMITAAAAFIFLCNGNAFAAEPKAILLRGLFGVFSTGMDGLAAEFREKGIDAEAAMYWYWDSAVNDVIRERKSGKVRPLILVGHSQGANNIIELARRLGDAGVRVDLLVTLAPVTPGSVPTNVSRAINYFQSPGWGSELVPARGFTGRLSNINLAEDWTVYHITLDKTAKIRSSILREAAMLTALKPAQDATGSVQAKARRAPDRLSQSGLKAPAQ